LIRSIDHIDFAVRNLEEFVEMFEKLGFKLIRHSPHYTGSVEFQLPGPNQPIFEIHQVGPRENPGISHMALLVEDLENECKELAAKGISIEEGPVLVKASGRTLAIIRNPDGYRIQLVDTKRREAEKEE